MTLITVINIYQINFRKIQTHVICLVKSTSIHEPLPNIFFLVNLTNDVLLTRCALIQKSKFGGVIRDLINH
jgi:hypothetical protein